MVLDVKLLQHSQTQRHTGKPGPGTPVGPYKNRKTGTLAGRYENRKTRALAGPYKNRKTGSLARL